MPCDPAAAYEIGPLARAWVRSTVGLALLLAATGAVLALRRRRRTGPCDHLPVATPDDDPVRARRARIARLVALGQRIGYTLWLVAIVVFFVGAATSFRPVMVTVVIGCLAVGSALLAPSIVISYGVRAADREDRA